MIYHDDFAKWEHEPAEYNWPKIDGAPHIDDYLLMVEPGRYGEWKQFEAGPTDRPYTSLDLAKAVQVSLRSIKSMADKRAALVAAYDELEELSDDVKNRRAVLTLDEGQISGDIGGYDIIDGEYPRIDMRIYEIAAGISTKVDYKKSELGGRRWAGPAGVPVLAVRSLSLIRR